MSTAQLIQRDPGYPASGEALLGVLAFVGANEHMVDLEHDHPLLEVGRELV
jgi:hypothetical protein